MQHGPQSLFRSGLVGLACTAIAACGGGCGSRSHQLSLRFDLGAAGLPQSAMWKSTPALGDTNGDGLLDLAAHSRLEHGAQVWLGNGQGVWTDASQGLGFSSAISCGGDVAFGDINKDGRLDLAVADHCKGIFVYLGDGQGHWRMSTQGLTPDLAQQSSLSRMNRGMLQGAEDLVLGDVNEDGFLDMVAASSDQGGLHVYLGDGSGSSWRETHADGLPSADDPELNDEQRGGWANEVLLYDVNGDGHLDVVASYYLGPRVWLGDGKGHWQSRSEGLPTPMVSGIFQGIAVGDINEDGRVDLAVANSVDGAQMFLQDPDGSWRATPDVLPELQRGAYAVALGDLDRDGHLDMVIGGLRSKKMEDGYGIFIVLGDGKGGWTEAEETNLPSAGLERTWGITLGDINGDGLLDFAVSTGGAQGMKMNNPSSLPHMQVWINKHMKG